MGDGRYIPIPQDGGQIVVIETPYDIEIIELQGRINGTVIPYGPRARSAPASSRRPGRSRRRRRRSPRDMAGYLNKRGAGLGAAEAVTGDGDLVADVARRPAEARAVKDDELAGRAAQP